MNMQVGSYEITIGRAGRFRLDGGAMFGVVPKVLWAARHPSDEKNRIDLCNNLLLLEGEGRTILVDTGNSSELSRKMMSMYAIDNTGAGIEPFLSEQGLTPGDITDVILTHLHFDHAGGAVQRDSEGQYKPAFPNACYYVQKRQFERAFSPSRLDQASYLPEMITPLKEAGRLELLDGPVTLFPGIELLVFDGHTPGQQLPLIRGNGTSLFYGGDLIPLSSHLSLPWIMAYDLNSRQTLEEKKVILPRAAAENWTLVFEHDTAVQHAAIAMKDGEFTIKTTLDKAAVID